jgi:hypothetical protein
MTDIIMSIYIISKNLNVVFTITLEIDV